MKTKIFLDSSDPAETKEMIELLGSLDGQTTNPTLVTRHPVLKAKIDAGEKLSKSELSEFYRKTIEEIAQVLPDKSISVEVYSDDKVTADQMIEEGKEMALWSKDVHIKLPVTLAGIESAQLLSQDGYKVNMTLVFSQDQAAAVYEATGFASVGDVFVSPFVGRLDDVGQSGISLVKNIQTMFKPSDGHVQILMASIRDVETLIWGIENNVDLITVPAKILRLWAAAGKPVRLTQEQKSSLEAKGQIIPLTDINFSKEVHTYELSHELTDKGLARFTEDWNAVLEEVQ